MRITQKYILIVIVFITGAQISTFIPDLEFSRKILKDNHYFLTVLNQGISNFGSEKQITQFKLASQHNYNAHLFHVSNNFRETYNEIRISQRLLRDLYHNLLTETYFKDCRKILDNIAPIIIALQDAFAAQFLKLAYRDLRLAKRYLRMGYNYNKFLYSNKIRYYIDSVKMARRAKRYAFLALIESKTPYNEKREFQKLSIDDVIRKTEKEKITDYDRVKHKLINFMNRKLIIDKDDYLTHHDDNYGYIPKTDILRANMKVLTSVSVTDRKTENGKKE